MKMSPCMIPQSSLIKSQVKKSAAILSCCDSNYAGGANQTILSTITRGKGRVVHVRSRGW